MNTTKMSAKYIALATALLLGSASCKPKFDEVSPKIAPVTEAVFASGTIEPKDAYTLTSISDGFITKCLVTENNLVANGQLLFELDNRQQNTQVAIAQNNMQYAAINADNNSPQVLQAKAELEKARVKKAADSATMARYQKLLATHSVSRQETENAQTAYQSSESAYWAATESYRSATNKVKQDLANTRAQLENVKAGNQYFNLTAIGNGKVYQIFKKQGDLVRRGEQVAIIGNPDSIVINLDVDEGSIAKVREGQQVLVELNTQKNKSYEAVISRIYPHFNEAAQSYKVEARFNSNIEGLIPGTQLQANIVTGQKEKAILIPRAYMLPGGRVQVKKGDVIDTVKITTGILSDEWAEVLSGIGPTDKLVKQK